MNTSAQHLVVDKRQLLAQVAHRKVRLVAAESNDFSAALFLVAHERAGLGKRVEHAVWVEVLKQLDACELTIGEYLEAEVRR